MLAASGAGLRRRTSGNRRVGDCQPSHRPLDLGSVVVRGARSTGGCQDGRADGDIAGILSGRSSVEETAKVVNFDDSGFRPRFFVFDHAFEEIILGRRFVDLRVGCARPVQPGR